ncbi:MAG: membrane-bound lytic murein transglycosylase MltF [Gammaproteobacteria bacterium]|nr:MAG: membrane-bound lytic murein transglycosylase MltF [Gammaproteobacteria bacterium]
MQFKTGDKSMAGIKYTDGRKRNIKVVKRFSIANLLVGFLLVCTAGLLIRSAPPSKLEQVRSAGELRVMARSGPVSHYQSPLGITGFEYTLLKGFADELKVKLVLNDEASADLLHSNESPIDLASPSALNPTNTKQQLRYSSAFMDLSLQLIYNTNQTPPADVKSLAGKTVLVVSRASVPTALQELQQSFPDIHWELVENVEMADLLEMVELGHGDYAVVDSAIFDIHRYSYPHTQVAFDISEPQPLAWAFAPSRDKSLYDAAQKYLAKIKNSGQLAQISSQFFDHFIEVNTDDALMFSIRFDKRFPRWADTIKAAANQYNLDWQLVAAVGYQESQWIPNAQSFTGVRGFMMLTPDTARELGVKNLEDPVQSIFGGAKYLRYLLDTLPASIQGEDRLYMALAAYNQGIGHLDDARALTRRLKGDGNSWADVSKAFPLLAKQEYYSKATYGYSRGWEPVIYVKNILNYQKILAFKESQQQLRIATSLNGDSLNLTTTAQEKSAVEKLNQLRLSSASSLSFL